MIKGDLVELKPADPDLSGWIIRELNNMEQTKHQNKGIIPITIQQEIKYINKMNDSSTDVLFHIYNNTLVGSISLNNINWIHRSAEIGVMIFKDHQGKGYGKEAVGLIDYYAFNILNLHRIWAECFIENMAMNEIFRYFSFIREGTITDVYFKNGKYNDVYIWNKHWQNVKGNLESTIEGESK